MALVRIDPRSCPLWRDTRTLQFGLDGALVLRDPKPWQERAVAELERGFPASAGSASPAGAGGAAAASGIDPARLAATADGPADGVAALLAFLEPVLRRDEQVGVGVAVRAADPLPEAVASVVVDALSERGWPAVWVAPDEDTVDPATPTVLLASHVVPPHLGVRCTRTDAPHVPIAFSAAGAEIGPVVLPGRTACLACLDLHRAERDPAWPVIASQLLLRKAANVTMSLAVEATALATRLLRDELSHDRPHEAPQPTRSVLVEVDDPADPADERTRLWRTHRPHPTCLCGPHRGRRATVSPGSGAGNSHAA